MQTVNPTTLNNELTVFFDLISAAPELYNALSALLDDLQKDTSFRNFYQRTAAARAALAKAEGK